MTFPILASKGRARLALATLTTALCACATVLGIDKNYVETDAGGDGSDVIGDAGDAGGDASPCQLADASSGIVFCDDFDQPPLGASWSAIQTKNGAFALDTSTSVSPPNSLYATLDATDASVTRQAKLVRGFIAAKAVDCRFSVQIAKEGTEPMRFVSIDVVNPDLPAYELNLYVDPNASPYVQEWAQLSDGGLYAKAVNFAPLFLLGTWVEVELYVEYGNTIRVTVDGNTVATMGSLAQTPQGETLLLGPFSQGTSAWSVRFDDLVCVVTP